MPSLAPLWHDGADPGNGIRARRVFPQDSLWLSRPNRRFPDPKDSPLTPKAPKHVPFPSREQVLEFIRAANGEVDRREIARAFHITGPERADLRTLLKELESEGALQRGRGRRIAPPGSLPEVAVLIVARADAEGDLFCKPEHWPEDEEPPRILLWPEPHHARRPGVGAEIGVGDRILARLTRIGDARYDARTIRRLAAAPSRLLGVLALARDGLRLRPTNRRDRDEYLVAPEDAGGAEPGELVEAELLPSRRLGLRRAKVIERLGGREGPRSISLVVVHSHDIPVDFPPEALAEAEAAVGVDLRGREDLRAVPLVTIDGEDARDFDDAVFAEPDDDPANPGGWRALVAIADVAHYVRIGAALDKAARERGNSVYFPDRVVPMLPEALSNGWCSLRPNEDRGCLAVWMIFDAEGNKLRHRFLRGLMRSAARLTYTQVQAARDGHADDLTAPLQERVIAPLYGVFQALLGARSRRGTLELDLPERKVVLDDGGEVARIEPRLRFDSHKLIEELMIAANVSAAETLEEKRRPCMYRVHDQPAPDKLVALGEFLESLDIPFHKGSINRSGQFNGVLKAARGTPHEHMVNEVVLRSQAQAEYSPDNIGHFGLALRRYAHFTSPIRRYADLLVHRALIAGLGLGDDGLRPGAEEDFVETAAHITATERRAAQAERDAVNRYTVSFLAAKVGATFAGRINGVTRAGLFVTLEDTGADGLIPIGSLPNDYYVHDDAHHCLRGQRDGLEFHLGAPVEVLLREANPVSGGLVFGLLQGGVAGAAKGRGFSGKTKGRDGLGKTRLKERGAAAKLKKGARGKPKAAGRDALAGEPVGSGPKKRPPTTTSRRKTR
ncbi:RNAse R [Rhodospirillum rubrum ATCC 11170]|uniref:Ribonuclease R n=3 Tax=Rhodospirillum rubrum TaxID=1085 RepID=Q2RPE7_RHORT|nr:RNAse R [Rhodospirillum rubrum ATCC 11170]MBK5955682.1 ribonuclease R [Rhodospirillum rubrum]QXG79940.1 ribonuclease R [Rhodospirillum rubrum]